MNSHIAELDQLNTRLEALIAKIESSWEGESCKAYVAMMRERLKKAQMMKEALIAFRSYMETTANNFDNLDRSGADRIRAC